MELTFYGQSCISVLIGGKHILFDPFITGNKLASHIQVDSIPADYILITHGHGDHTGDLVPIAQRTGALCITNLEIVSWLAGKGITNTHPLAQGGSRTFDFGKVKCVNAVHSSSLPDGSEAGNPCGFVISSPEGNFYFAGDTGLTLDMQLIPRFAKLDFSVLPIGDNFTMGYEEAAMAADLVGCKKVVGVHYDTFDFIKIDHQAVKDFFKKGGYQLLLPAIGETINL